MLLVDAQLDLAINSIHWDRDLNLEAYDIRQREAKRTAKGRARGTTSLPELRKAEMAVSLASI